MRRLEEQYPTQLAVVGVHSGKFTAERVTSNVRQAVQRLEVAHPVVNDRFFRIWRSYGVSAWPTLVLIDPGGYYVGSHAGEVTAESFAPFVERLARRFAGQLDERPLPLRLEPQAATPLRFPGKLHLSGDRLFISDTGHNRLLVLRLDRDGSRGQVEAVVGGGRAGLADGGFEEAAFDHPQGLYLGGDTLYVADTGNHALRTVDLGRRQVRTLAGAEGEALGLSPLGVAARTTLRSPWDVLALDGSLYVAMAGSHQLWRVRLATGEIGPYAGTGREDLVDGPAAEAALAQPTGLAHDGRRLYFADCESSAVRWADLQAGGRVNTVVGTGLFDFGDRDGRGEAVRLQHSYGLAYADGRLYVADTYTNKVKVIDPDARTAAAFLGTGEAGDRDGEQPQFWEPQGIAAGEGRLYIADTNNHKIKVADVGARRVETLAIEGL